MFLSKVEVIGLGDLISCACDSDRTRRNWKAHVVLWFDMRKLQQSRQRQKGTLSILFNRFHSFFLSFFPSSPDWSFRSLSGLFLGPLLQSTDREARNLQYRLLAAADSVCYFVSQWDGMMAHLCIVWVRLRKVLKPQRRRRRSFWKKNVSDLTKMLCQATKHEVQEGLDEIDRRLSEDTSSSDVDVIVIYWNNMKWQYMT
jgi:hypothetical protein